MQLSLTNNTDEPEIIGTPDGSWTDALTPGTSYDLDNEAAGVVIIGDKPDVREQFAQAASTLTGMVRHLVDLVAGRKQQAEAAHKVEQVSVTILNRGAEAVRVILGNGTTDTTIRPGGSQTCMAPGYIEIRELGHAPQQGGTPD
jgi:hypothetical protein